MAYKIMIFSSPGCKIVDKIMTGFKKIKNKYSVNISNLDNIGTIDITQIFSSIYNGFDGVIVIIRGIIKKDNFVSLSLEPKLKKRKLNKDKDKDKDKKIDHKFYDKIITNLVS